MIFSPGQSAPIVPALFFLPLPSFPRSSLCPFPFLRSAPPCYCTPCLFLPTPTAVAMSLPHTCADLRAIGDSEIPRLRLLRERAPPQHSRRPGRTHSADPVCRSPAAPCRGAASAGLPQSAEEMIHTAVMAMTALPGRVWRESGVTVRWKATEVVKAGRKGGRAGGGRGRPPCRRCSGRCGRRGGSAV